MKDHQFEEFDLKLIYQKLVAPSTPRTVKACDFFKQPNLIAPLQKRMAQAVKQQINSNL